MGGKVNSLYDAMKANPVEGDTSVTGYVENWAAALGLFIDEDLSISRFLNNEVYDERNRAIDKIMADDANAREAVESLGYQGEIDYGVASRYLKRHGYQVQDDEEVFESIKDTLRNRREYAQDIMNRAQGMGTLGQFTGTMHAAMLDPVNIASLAIPAATLAKGGSTLGAVATGAKIGLVSGVASETLIQPLVYNWKGKIDSPYSAADAIYNIVAAGAGGATLEGLATGLRQIGVNARKGELTGDADLDGNIVDDVVELEPEIQEAGKVAKRVKLEEETKPLDGADEAEYEQWRKEMEAEAAYDRYDDADVEADEVVDVIEEVEARQQRMLEDDSPAFSEFDEDDFMNMSDAEKEAYVQEQLQAVYGDELDDVTVSMENFDEFEYGSSVEGEVSRSTFMEQQDEIIDAIDEFRGCWGGG